MWVNIYFHQLIVARRIQKDKITFFKTFVTSDLSSTTKIVQMSPTFQKFAHSQKKEPEVKMNSVIKFYFDQIQKKQLQI